MAQRPRVLAAVLVGCTLLAVVWAWFAPGRLYVCSDPFPPTEFIPPFVHHASPGHAYEADHYIASPVVVYAAWFCLAGLCCGVGWLTVRVISRMSSRAGIDRKA